MPLSRDDKHEWAHTRGTQELLKDLKESRVDTMEAWAAEKFTAAEAEKTMQQNATALGGIRVLNDLIEQIESAMEEEQEDGSE